MEKSRAKSILIISCAGYLSFGLLWASLGPLLSQFASLNGTTLATIGGIYSAIFLGAVTAQIVLGRFTDRWGQLRALTIALITLALGITGVSLSRWLPLTFALAFVAGMGQGITNLSGNVLVARIYKENSVMAVNLVNVFFGIGACIGPLVVSGSLYLWHNGFPALWFSALLMMTSALILLFGYFKANTGTQDQSAGVHSEKHMRFTAFLWSMGILLLLYVGSESAMGGWATTYMQKTTSLDIELAALVTSGFWLAITLGRVMGVVLGSRLSARRMLMLCLASASLGAVVFMAGYGNSGLSILAIFLIGLGFGAIYPTGMAMITTAFPETPGQAGTVITSMSAVGGMIIPWLQGVVMQQSGIRAGTYMIAILVALLIVSFGVNQWAEKRAQLNSVRSNMAA